MLHTNQFPDVMGFFAGGSDGWGIHNRGRAGLEHRFYLGKLKKHYRIKISFVKDLLSVLK
jgi:hypothetical protein